MRVYDVHEYLMAVLKERLLDAAYNWKAASQIY